MYWTDLADFVHATDVQMIQIPDSARLALESLPQDCILSQIPLRNLQRHFLAQFWIKRQIDSPHRTMTQHLGNTKVPEFRGEFSKWSRRHRHRIRQIRCRHRHTTADGLVR